ncbi:hypothetical protein PsorP6_003924 [Peronosclerospora sorghi]|uniref:Uncharacterized protein n=1 Tax=Peronosclerospora sorghi TaxID=230839 RepID=A0ACC0VQZ9_9STRA|nr:hypothetical protein PsorP6_003924 [Peronosclerospora sorghi]
MMHLTDMVRFNNVVCVPTDLNVIAHPFFKSIDFDNHMQATLPSSQFCGSEFFPLVKGLSDVEKCRNVSSEILDHSTKTLEDKVKALSSREKSILMHILRRKRLLHLPGIYPCFFSSASCGRCLYACNRGYVGFTYDLQNRWTSDFSFMQLSGPKLGRAAASAEADDQGGSTWETESRAFLKAINILNSLRPAFVVFCGDFVNSKPSQTFYEAQVTAFQKLVNQITPQVRLVCTYLANLLLTHSNGSGEFHSCEEMLKYQKHFGDTRFSFWFGGIKYIVVNTTALCRESEFIDEVNAQTDWIKKELDDGKLCARGTMVISGHSLCPQSQDAHVSNKEHATAQVEVSQEVVAILRTKYWEMIHSGQVCAMISGSPTIDSVTTIMTRANEEEADEYQCELVSCKMPWSEFSNSIYRTEVTEAGTLTKRYNVQTSITTVYPNTPKGTAQASKSNTLAPEEENQETIVAAELVTVSIHSPDYRDSH